LSLLLRRIGASMFGGSTSGNSEYTIRVVVIGLGHLGGYERQMPIDREKILDAIRQTAKALGHSPSRAQFVAGTGISEYRVLQHFPSWREAVRVAGFDVDPTNLRLDPAELLQDWGELVRTLRQIPTRIQYRREGKHSPGTFENKFGPWSTIPARFRDFARDKPEWADVLALLPKAAPRAERTPGAYPRNGSVTETTPPSASPKQRHSKLWNRPTYGNPVDFRGLRHEPTNEAGVIFLFGMVARELGYMVEAVQDGFPDCEAKRQIALGKWQKVFIEFEFESRNFRDHGHPTDGCDVIVCWHHNWPDCPDSLDVLELKAAIRMLAKSED